ncbi:MAG TPA: TspO/MBR family protein [Allosphingosinicella sp.]|nr:TspO/MBR family protein [Allosphingosinicella sp.]
MAGIASRSQLRMSFLRYALFTVPAVLLAGTLSGRLAGAGAGNPWFEALRKPAFMPPGWVFGAAWTILYILLGISLAMVLHARGARDRKKALILIALLLALTFAWPALFFAWHKLALALSLIAAMIVVTVAAIFLVWRIRIVAALLLYPYLGWLMFAAALSWQVMALNPRAETLVPEPRTIDIPLN